MEIGTEEYNFWNKVRLYLPEITNSLDIEAVDKTIEDCYKAGWTITETVSYCECLEHVNPELDEDVGLAGMKSIMEAVAKRKGLTSCRGVFG